jgi:hypothetical protein
MLYVISRPNVEADTVGARLIAFASRPWFSWSSWLVRIFGGHYGVLKTVLLGLFRLNVPFKFNPPVDSIPEGSSVLILSGNNELDLLLNKDRLQITVGPNFSNDVSSILNVLEDNRIVNVTVPSGWVSKIWAKAYPTISRKVTVWPAASEVSGLFRLFRRFKKPAGVLVYLKNNHSLGRAVIDLLHEQGLRVVKLVYGRHKRFRYLSELSRAELMVYVGKSESQGLALQEAWELGVPTMVFWDSEHKITDKRGKVLADSLERSSAAPYLSPRNGFFWETLGELKSLMSDFRKQNWTPRTSSGPYAAYPRSYIQSVDALLKLMAIDYKTLPPE